MIFDLAVAVIVVLAMALGFRKGFVFTFIHTVDWILALVVAFIWSPALKDFLMLKTPIYDVLFNKIQDEFSDSLGNATISYNFLPESVNAHLTEISMDVSANLAENLAGFLFNVLCFVLIVLAVKLILWLVLGLLSKQHRDGVTGFVDGILGMLIGFVKGFIIVSVLLALMLPVVNLFSPEHISSINDSLRESTFAKEIYDNNIIMLILRDFIS